MLSKQLQTLRPLMTLGDKTGTAFIGPLMLWTNSRTSSEFNTETRRQTGSSLVASRSFISSKDPKTFPPQIGGSNSWPKISRDGGTGCANKPSHPASLNITLGLYLK